MGARITNAGIGSTRYADGLARFGGGLCYETEAFATDTEITGAPTLVLWIALDVPDTDFVAILHEILPGCESVQLSDMQQRARHRELARQEMLVPLNEAVRYEFKDFWWFSRRVRAGSRLRLVFRCPNSIHYQRNFNSGGVVAEETEADARVAHVTIFHDAAHSSYLELPFVESVQ